MSIFNKSEPSAADTAVQKEHPAWIVSATWIIALLMTALTVFSLVQYFSGKSLFAMFALSNKPSSTTQSISDMPNYAPGKDYQAVERSANPQTVLPSGYRSEVVEYTIASGDSLFGIAEEFEVEPESILWANEKTLHDDPHLISVGDQLKIPPVDGILYEWQTYDTLEGVAAKYKASVEDILLYPGNNLDITNPVIEPGMTIMIPNGSRELQPWVVPVIAGDNAGVTAQIAGPGSCTPAGGYYGTFSFVWPAPYPGQISGNHYYSGHQAIDAMCFEGDSIFASDSGVVIYRGPISGGYGNLVAIDHQNGFLTIYAHLSGFAVECGQSVTQGQTIGYCGSTGNSTGAHLHFEIRQNGGFVDPTRYLIQ